MSPNVLNLKPTSPVTHTQAFRLMGLLRVFIVDFVIDRGPSVYNYGPIRRDTNGLRAGTCKESISLQARLV